MIALLAILQRRQYPKLLLAVLYCLILACANHPPKQTNTHPGYKKLEGENRKLKQTLAKNTKTIELLENKTAKIQLRLLERDAQIKQLEERLNSQQVMLDAAIQEVVRAKAKLRSLESKAEAASEIAEAEIALKALQSQLKGPGRDSELIKAQELLKMSASEFKKENYGGALYLSSQAKGHIRAGQLRLGGRQKVAPIKRLPPIKGEVLFSLPLPLKVLKTSNLREGPDLKYRVVTKFEKGTPLIGYSYKGDWVRVNSKNGTTGWIYQTLVGPR